MRIRTTMIAMAALTGSMMTASVAAAPPAKEGYAPPICPHILGWPDDVKQWANGSPWIKALDITSVGIAREREGSRVFYRVFDHASGPDGDADIGGQKFGEEILDRLKWLDKEKWPDAIGYQNEFNNVNEKSARCFIEMYDVLRAGGYEGMIVYGSYGPGGPTDHSEWARPHVKEACLKADAIETHEYFDLTVKHLNTYLAHRHVRALKDYPWLRNKPWFIGEFGSDGVTPSEDPHRRSGWRQKQYTGDGDNGPQKMTADQYIEQIEIYRWGDPADEVVTPAPNVLAVFLFQTGAPPHQWGGWETRGTKLMGYMKSTWKPTHAVVGGKVLDAEGKPVEGAKLTLEPANQKVAQRVAEAAAKPLTRFEKDGKFVIASVASLEAQTDYKGRYWFFAVEPGAYTLKVGKTDERVAPIKLTLKAGDLKTVNIPDKPKQP